MAVASLLAVMPAELPDSVVVTAAPPLDSQRLADALRTYLDEFGIRVQVAPATAGGDLRTQLDDARHLGESVRAVAVVRAEREVRGEIEVELYDLATDKALVAAVRRPARDEDLYRALALKVQAILRATFSEARGDLQPGSPVGRMLAANDAGLGAPEVDHGGALRRPRARPRPTWPWRRAIRSCRFPSAACCCKGWRSTGSCCRARGWS